MKKISWIPFVIGILYSVGAQAQAVVGFATVTGTVQDYTGSGIPDTTVILSNEKMGIRRQMDTTDDGTFNASAMVPGSGYNLKVTRKGFLDIEYKDFDILVGHTLNFKVSLAQEAGRRTEAEKPSVEMEDSNYGLQITFTPSELDSLPSRNRDVNTLIPLAPAVTPDHANGKQAFLSEPGSDAVLMDGVLTNNTYFYDRAPLAPPVTQDAVEEMQVVSAGALVEFGHTMAGAANFVTRSGGDTIHAEAYDYYNNHTLNAPDRYAPGFRPPGWQHQFGINAGGPVGWGHLFWFLNLEDLDGHYEELNRTSNQLLVNPAGTAIAPANCAATTTATATTATPAQCTSAIAFLNAQLNRVVQSSLASLSGLAKIDWRPNDFNSISVEADAMHRHSPNGSDIETAASNAGVLGNNGTYTDESRYARAGYTAVWSGNAVNEVRGAWVHDRFSDYLNTQLLPSTGPLGIDVAGTPFGANLQYPIALSEQRYQIVDNFTFTAGTHLFKVGFDYSKTTDRNDQIIDRSGDYVYPTLTSFAQDFSANTVGHKNYTDFTQSFGLPVVNLPITRLGSYAQDTWRPTRRVTLDLGILWEKTFYPQPLDTNPTYFQTGSIGSPSVDFSPRIGLAYQLDNRTVLRAGLGAFYQPFPGQFLESLYTGNAIYQLPVTITPTQTNAPVFARIIGSTASIPVDTADVTFAVGKLRSPVSAQGVVAVERHINDNLTLSLNYLYDRGLQLWTATEQNLNTPTITKTYIIDDAAGTAVNTYTTLLYNVKSNVNFAHVYQVGNGGRSAYNGLSIQLRRRLTHGLSAQASYTWSHAIDDVSGTPVVAGFVPSYSIPGSYNTDKGNSSFNQPDRANVTWTWQPTFAGGDAGIARYVINGWQLSGSATFASGLAETPLVLLSAQQFTGVTMSYLNSLNGSGGWARAPFVGVNTLPTGPQYDVDARVTRDIPITERFKARLMFEAFNLLNTQYNTSVNTAAYLATAGVIKPIPGAGLGNGADGSPWGDNARHLQLALRLVF